LTQGVFALILLIGSQAANLLGDPATAIYQLDQRVTASLRSEAFPTDYFGAPMAASLIPWIDRAIDNGLTLEDWMGFV
jgi:aspartate-semialdehyde dehydrogenase